MFYRTSSHVLEWLIWLLSVSGSTPPQTPQKLRNISSNEPNYSHFANHSFRVIQKDSDRHVTEFVDAGTIKKLKSSIAASRAAAQNQSEAVE